MLSKQKHCIWLLEKSSCFTVNTVVEFLHCRFCAAHEKEAAIPRISTKRLFWKFHAWQNPFLARKFQVERSQTHQESTPSPLFSEWFCENFQTSRHWLSYRVRSAKKMITWLTNQTNARQANAWGTSKFLDNSSLTIINPLMPGGNKKVKRVCLSKCDLFVTTRH